MGDVPINAASVLRWLEASCGAVTPVFVLLLELSSVPALLGHPWLFADPMSSLSVPPHRPPQYSSFTAIWGAAGLWHSHLK